MTDQERDEYEQTILQLLGQLKAKDQLIAQLQRQLLSNRRWAN
jgi:hypothetical protein